MCGERCATNSARCRNSVRSATRSDCGRNRELQQSVVVQSLDPLSIRHVAFPTRHAPQGTGTDQQTFKSTLFQPFKKRNPVDPCAFHRHCFDVMFRQPICDGIQINRVVPKALDQLSSLVGGDTDDDFFRADVCASRIRIDFAHAIKWTSLLNPFRTFAFLSHFFSFLDMGRSRSIKVLAFSSGSFPPCHHWINQFDRRPQCTSELRPCASPMRCTAS